SLRLENNGSVARDHSASERTLLACMRTSLAIAASGVGVCLPYAVIYLYFYHWSILALVQLFSTAPEKSVHRLHQYIQLLGVSVIVISLIVLFIGASHTTYFTIQSALVQGYFPVARLTTGFIAVLLTALVTMTFAVPIAGKLTPKV
ncbi:hypothetical protein BDN70DRAFT_795061, partial [Pholiota conissans]